MKLSKLALASCAAALLFSFSSQAKNEVRKAYIFGFASSFNDSTVYFTDIQEVDSAWFTSKNNFLISRENYSYQLRDYLNSIGESQQTCMVEYNFDPKKLEKIWNKLYARYAHNQKKKNNQKQTSQLPPYKIKNLKKEQFTFQEVAPTEEYVEETPKLTKAEKKEAKKAHKIAKQEKKMQGIQEKESKVFPPKKQ